MKKIKASIFLSLLLLTFISHAQSPWVHEPGKGYGQFGLSTIPSYEKVFQGNLSNLKDLDGSIYELGSQVYGEIGLGKGFEAIVSVPFRYISANPTSDIVRSAGNVSGFGNIELGAKYQVINKPFLLTAQILVGLPTASTDVSRGLRTGYEASYIIPTVSSGNGGEKFYYFAYLGSGIYTDDFSDDFRFGFEYGRKFHSKLWTILTFNLRESFENGTRVDAPSFEDSFLFVDNQSYSSLALKLSYEFNNHLGLNGSANLISVRANNLPFRSPFSLSIYNKW